MENNKQEDLFKNEMIERFNNYPKAIELLKLIKESETWNEGQYSIDIPLNKELNEFLKQIEN
jgi:hypothetical protein